MRGAPRATPSDTRRTSCNRLISTDDAYKDELDPRHAFEACAEFITKILYVFDDVFIGPLPCGEILREWQQLRHEHDRQIGRRRLRDKVLDRAERYIPPCRRAECTLKVATITRMTFSLAALCATSTRRGMMSKRLTSCQNKIAQAEAAHLLLNLLRNFLIESEQPEAKPYLVGHLRRRIVLEDVYQPVQTSVMFDDSTEYQM